jgi:NOL1/NOP2/sun family putative RNA methylase
MADFFHRYAKLGVKLDKSITTAPALRVNPLVANAGDVLYRLESKGVKLEKIPYLPFGYWIRDARFSLGATTEYLRGMYYLQDAAAQLPVLILDPQPGERVLDMCAAPGGKTTQLAAMMQNKGVIVSFEKALHRLASLKANLERCRVQDCVVYHASAARASGVFDKVLLDAPCAGNFASDPEWLKKRSIADVKHNVPLQKQLLSAASKCLRLGGTLVYSTCSLEPEENELVIDWAVKNLPLKCMPIDISVGVPAFTKPFGIALDSQLVNCRRLWPVNGENEGFFVAKMVRVDG